MGAHVPADSEHPVVGQLDRFYVFCLKAFRALRDIELYSLAFLQAAEAARLNRREMDENIFAILAADEAKAFGVVKPLYCSCFQLCSYFLFSI
jgi:hypothetical protein